MSCSFNSQLDNNNIATLGRLTQHETKIPQCIIIIGLFKANSLTSSSKKMVLFGKRTSPSLTKLKHFAKSVHFNDDPAIRREYSFEWELESSYWYSKQELKQFNEQRFDDADILRKERGISTSSRNDADSVRESRRDIFIGDKVTKALDDVDDNHEISLRGIEHFVFPLLQKEMMRRKKELKHTVLVYSRDKMERKKDPLGVKLAERAQELSQWARDVATERGVKYCEMKRGGGRGGGLLKCSKMKDNMKARRGFAVEKSQRDFFVSD